MQCHECCVHKLMLFIGASLSEPHTSVIALCTCVSIYPSMDRPLTVNFNILSVHAAPCRRALELSHENEYEGLLPDCRVGVKESESEDYSK